MDLPIDLPSLNAYMRWHYRKQMQWRDILCQYVCALGWPLPQFDGPVYVRVVRRYGFRKRAYDTDNLYASVKPLLDVLKRPRGRSRKGLSIITEDNPQFCHLTVTQEKSPDKATRISIEVLDKGIADAML